MVNKSWTNAAEIFFIILFDPKYICLDIKSIFISGREDITKILFDVGHCGQFEKLHFSLFGHFLEFNSI